MERIQLSVKGMACVSDARRIERNLKKAKGVRMRFDIPRQEQPAVLKVKTDLQCCDSLPVGSTPWTL